MELFLKWTQLSQHNTQFIRCRIKSLNTHITSLYTIYATHHLHAVFKVYDILYNKLRRRHAWLTHVSVVHAHVNSHIATHH